MTRKLSTMALLSVVTVGKLRSGQVAFAAPGRVDAMGGTIAVGAAMSGQLAAVKVREGDRVSAGQVLAVFACPDLSAEVEAASAQVEAARQARNRMLRGSTGDERNEAAARVSAAEAVVREARARHRRYAELVARNEISQLEFDRTRRDLDAAEANLETIEHRRAAVWADVLPEDLARQEAEIGALDARRRGVTERLEMCTVRAPSAGIVLRRPMQVGESFSLGIALPIAIIADLSRLEVRAEVDERDVGRVRLGQNARIRVDAYPESLPARVVEIENAMGRKNVRSGDPAEKSDRDILEVLLDWQGPHPKLPLGLRVTVEFLE
jgi:HlyD family secretion protein